MPHKLMLLTSKAIGILGVTGTIFAWMATTFFLGDVEIKPDRPVSSLSVKVTAKNGQCATYYAQHVQLMPGPYHLEIEATSQTGVLHFAKSSAHSDVNVGLWKVTSVPVSLADATGDNSTAVNAPAASKNWWQFWTNIH